VLQDRITSAHRQSPPTTGQPSSPPYIMNKVVAIRMMARAMAIDAMFSASGDFETRSEGVTAETFERALMDVD